MKALLYYATSGEGCLIASRTAQYKSKNALLKKYIYGATVWHSQLKTAEDNSAGLKMQFDAADQLGWSKEKQKRMFRSICCIEAARREQRMNTAADLREYLGQWI